MFDDLPDDSQALLVMFLPIIASLAPLGLLATSIAANPAVVQVRDTPFTLPFARHINVTGTLDIVLRDQARARYFAKQSGTPTSEVASNVGVTNAGVDYVLGQALVVPLLIVGLIFQTKRISLTPS